MFKEILEENRILQTYNSFFYLIVSGWNNLVRQTYVERKHKSLPKTFNAVIWNSLHPRFLHYAEDWVKRKVNESDLPSVLGNLQKGLEKANHDTKVCFLLYRYLHSILCEGRTSEYALCDSYTTSLLFVHLRMQWLRY